jgi:hypothetical protein
MFTPGVAKENNGRGTGEYFNHGLVLMKERRIFKCTLATPNDCNPLTPELRGIAEI